jgi:hypothetical protein
LLVSSFIRLLFSGLFVRSFVCLFDCLLLLPNFLLRSPPSGFPRPGPPESEDDAGHDGGHDDEEHGQEGLTDVRVLAHHQALASS